MIISRKWEMPNSRTFEMKCVKDFISRHLVGVTHVVDPFARDNTLATITNDLNPTTKAQYHMDAFEFGAWLKTFGQKVGAVMFDPPYSPRQLKECYESIGRAFTQEDGQIAGRWTQLKNDLTEILVPSGKVLSFGWNSSGFGKTRGFEIEEILIVCHGSAHNDTICVAERKL